MSDEPHIDVRDLRVVRGGRVAVDGVSFTARSGDVTGLLGPSGCGKSSLLRSVVGVQVVESGDVRVLGLPAGSRELRHRVGYVTQAPSVYEDLTVTENVRFFARVLGAGPEDVERSMADVDLHESGNRVVGTLSGGQRSR
ncbi:MAG TPA: ATP-binding cassette domain-containing protein, partial [Marmoricola sp.]|nr:ATP-binding cassette domain-containing protein [Marmoricola sp.]